MRVAVTGGDGFVGRSTVRALREQGHDAIVVDRATGHDILTTDLRRTFQDVDAVIHLAGVLGTEELFEMPMQAIDINIGGTLRVLEACTETATAYTGITMPEIWANVYQATKRCSRELASAWHQHHGVPVSHVRAFNTYGPHQKHYGVQKILPTFAIRGWRNEPLPIWGSGQQTVDLIHCDDLGQMLVDAMAFGEDQVFDGGTGHAITVNEVAEMVLEITGSTAGVDYLPMRKGESAADVVAGGEGWSLLGWSPEFRHAALADTVVWYREIARAA